MDWFNSKSITHDSNALGKQAEQIALTHLKSQGLTHLESNFNCRLGEIDLIMQANQCLVFVEVKYRKSNRFGGALGAISAQKCKKIRKTAAFYMQQHGLNEYNTCYRFDVVAIEGNLTAPQLNWLINAFN